MSPLPTGARIRILRDQFGGIEVTGANEDALRTLARFGFRAPLVGPGPVVVQALDGPLDEKWAATAAARALEADGHLVHLDPDIELHPDSERAHEALGIIAEQLRELTDLMPALEGPEAIAGVLGQLVIGRGNALDRLGDLLGASADAIERVASPDCVDLAQSVRKNVRQTGLSASSLTGIAYALNTAYRMPRSAAAQVTSPAAAPVSRRKGAAPSTLAVPVAGTVQYVSGARNR